MQLQNNADSNRRRIIVITAALIAIALIATIIITITSGPKVDKPSGEEISEPKGREPESYGVDKDLIVFYGISELTRAGISEFMVNTFRQQLQDFSAKHQDYIKRASVYTNSVSLQDNDTQSIVIFDVLINDKEKLNVKLQYTSLLEVRVIVEDAGGSRIIDSGIIRHRSTVDEEYTGDGAAPEDR